MEVFSRNRARLPVPSTVATPRRSSSSACPVHAADEIAVAVDEMRLTCSMEG
jgi:hypothetical protein